MRSVDRESDHTSCGLRQGARVVVSYHSDADGRQQDGNPAQCSHVYDITECSRYARRVFGLERFGEAVGYR